MITQNLTSPVYLTSCSALSSDHLPVLIDAVCCSSFQHSPDCPDFRCTDWANFHTHLEETGGSQISLRASLHPPVSTFVWLWLAAKYSLNARHNKRTHQDKKSQLGDIKNKYPDPTHYERDTSLVHQGVIVVCTSDEVSLSVTPKGVILSVMLQKGVTSFDTLISPRHLQSDWRLAVRPETSSLRTSWPTDSRP